MISLYGGLQLWGLHIRHSICCVIYFKSFVRATKFSRNHGNILMGYTSLLWPICSKGCRLIVLHTGLSKKGSLYHTMMCSPRLLLCSPPIAWLTLRFLFLLTTIKCSDNHIYLFSRRLLLHADYMPMCSHIHNINGGAIRQRGFLFLFLAVPPPSPQPHANACTGHNFVTNTPIKFIFAIAIDVPEPYAPYDFWHQSEKKQNGLWWPFRSKNRTKQI